MRTKTTIGRRIRRGQNRAPRILNAPLPVARRRCYHRGPMPIEPPNPNNRPAIDALDAALLAMREALRKSPGDPLIIAAIGHAGAAVALLGMPGEEVGILNPNPPDPHRSAT